MADIYSSLDLGARQIRLLRAHWILGIDESSHNHKSGFPNCELAVFSLDDMPRYRALSYCWGLEQADQRININDKPFLVRSNLYELLKLLHEERWQDLTRTDTAWIFVDAICINQQDLEERSSQVGLMNEIYRCATEVIIWLGVETDYPAGSGQEQEEEQQQLLQDPLDCQERFDMIHAKMAASASVRLCGYSGKSSLDDLFQGIINRPIARAIVRPLVHQPFWSRLWIVQEIILASNLTIWYHKLRVSWDVLYACLQYGWDDVINTASGAIHKLDVSDISLWLDDSSWETTTKTDRPALETYMLLTQRLKYNNDARERKMDISTAVRSFARREASDVRDKVWGLLGMTASVQHVDYAKSDTTTIYTSALLEGLLEILYRYEDHPDRTQLLGNESARFTVMLATALQQDLHAENTIAAHATRICLSFVCQSFGPTSTIWTAKHRLKLSSFRRFGAPGLKGFKLAKNAIEYTASVGAKVWDMIGSDSDYERITLRRFAGVIKWNRCFPRWRFKNIMESVPDLPRMTSDRAASYLGQIKSFPVEDQAVVLAEGAIQCLRTHLSDLDLSQDRLSQDHARVLEGYVEELEKHLSELHTKGQTSFGRNVSVSSGVLKSQHDLRVIMHFLERPGFSTKLLAYYNKQNFKQDTEAELASTLRMADYLLYNALNKHLDSSNEVNEFVRRRSHDRDFLDWTRKFRKLWDRDFNLYPLSGFPSREVHDVAVAGALNFIKALTVELEKPFELKPSAAKSSRVGGEHVQGLNQTDIRPVCDPRHLQLPPESVLKDTLQRAAETFETEGPDNISMLWKYDELARQRFRTRAASKPWVTDMRAVRALKQAVDYDPGLTEALKHSKDLDFHRACGILEAQTCHWNSHGDLEAAVGEYTELE